MDIIHNQSVKILLIDNEMHINEIIKTPISGIRSKKIILNYYAETNKKGFE